MEKLDIEKLNKLLECGDFDTLKKIFKNIDPADAADLLEELDSEKQEEVFNILDDEMASEVIVEMEPNELDDFVDNLSPDKIAAIIGEMAPDDAADFFGDLEQQEQATVLSLLDGESREELKGLLDYDEESAGGIMTPEFCSVSAESTVKEAITALVDVHFSDPVSMIFAVDENRKPVGWINIPELLAQEPDMLVKNVVKSLEVFANVNEDQESIARNFRKYDLYVMPVVDDEGRLVGRITADDVMDVMHNEASEDLAFMVGAPDIEHNEDSPLKIVGFRLPWLMITLFAGMVISYIINKLIGLNSAERLAAFVPVILAMGGNTGMQASAVTVRSIALGEISFNKLFAVFSREIMVGMIMGIVCGLITGAIVYFSLSNFSENITRPILQFSFIVGFSMCTAMTFAAVTGSIMPILLNQFNIDPAVASGPFVTTGNDLSASLIYFIMCYLLLSV